MYKAFFILFSLLFFSSASYSKTQEIHIGAGDWQDYTAPDGSGIYFEIIKKIYPNYQLKFHTDTFNRVIADFEQNKLDMVVGIYREDVSEAIFADWFIDTEYPVVAIYDPKRLTLNSFDDLADLTLSWLRGYNFDRYLPHGIHHYEVTDIDTGFKLLEKERVDAFVDFPYNLLPEDLKKYTTFEILPARHIYVAFAHNRLGKKLAKQFDQKMIELRDSGFLAQLYKQEYEHSQLESFNPKKQKIIIYTDTIDAIGQVKKYQNTPLSDISIALVLNNILSQLDKYSIDFQVVKNFAKIKTKAQQDNVCFNNLLKTTERLNYLVASKPVSLSLDFKLYTTLLLDLDEPIDLVDFFNKNKQYTLGLETGRSYGDKLDSALKNIRMNQKISQSVTTQTLLKQLHSERFNFVIEYPSTIQAYWQKLANKTLYSYELKNTSQHNIGYTMCANSKIGQQFITDFNQALSWFYHTKMFFNAQINKVPFKERAKFIEIYKQVFQ